VSPAGIKLKVSPCHLRDFIVVNRGKVILHSLLNDFLGRIRKRCGSVKNIQSLASLHLQIFRGIVVSAPGNKHHKREQYPVKQSKGIENNGRDLVVLLEYFRRILLSHEVKADQGREGGNRRDHKE